MSGHSHWSTVRHKKGASDAKKGKTFSKVAMMIMQAARQGGGKPEENPKLRLAVEKARQINMPKDNIERAIKKGTGELEGVTMEELVYEAYGPGGVAFLVEVLTDNRNRTAPELRKIFETRGGSLAGSNSVAYLFKKKGLFSISAEGVSEDDLLEATLEAGVESIERVNGDYEVICDVEDFDAVKEALQAGGFRMDVAELTNVASTQVDVDTQTGKKIVALMEALEDHDDVQNISSNVNFSEEMISQ